MFCCLLSLFVVVCWKKPCSCRRCLLENRDGSYYVLWNIVPGVRNSVPAEGGFQKHCQFLLHNLDQALTSKLFADLGEICSGVRRSCWNLLSSAQPWRRSRFCPSHRQLLAPGSARTEVSTVAVVQSKDTMLLDWIGLTGGYPFHAVESKHSSLCAPSTLKSRLTLVKEIYPFVTSHAIRSNCTKARQVPARHHTGGHPSTE